MSSSFSGTGELKGLLTPFPAGFALEVQLRRVKTARLTSHKVKKVTHKKKKPATNTSSGVHSGHAMSVRVAYFRCQLLKCSDRSR